MFPDFQSCPATLRPIPSFRDGCKYIPVVLIEAVSSFWKTFLLDPLHAPPDMRQLALINVEAQTITFVTARGYRYTPSHAFVWAPYDLPRLGP
jgi:hypothetical protein